jgi:hypothetical protein
VAARVYEEKKMREKKIEVPSSFPPFSFPRRQFFHAR